ncbi:MAG: sigma-70 family RNA polymerase sigma factor [Taibaiella sp.]|nr:sigma-70 family RNA polymerase sigma factor [Taibaiella sp.]
MSIDSLVQLLKKGDQLAFRQLVDGYQQRVLSTAMSMVQDLSTAEDITQEVFVTVYKSILSFNEKSTLSTWIYRITVNKCLDHLRSQKRQKRSGFLTELFHHDSGEEAIDKRDFVHPGVLAENREKAQYLFAAIKSLQENQKTVFILAHIEELPQKEVAEIMGLSLKAVESLLQRAKGNLRKLLAEMR